MGLVKTLFLKRDRNIAHKWRLGLPSWKLFLHVPPITSKFPKLYLLFGVVVNDLNLAQKARHSVGSSLLGAVIGHRALQGRSLLSPGDTPCSVGWKVELVSD